MSPDLVCGRPPPVLENNKSDGWNKPTPEPHGVLSSVTLKDNCLRDNPQDGLNEKFVLLSTFGWKDVRSVRLLPFTSDPKIVEGLFGRKPFLNRWTCLGFCHLMMKSKPPPKPACGQGTLDEFPLMMNESDIMENSSPILMIFQQLLMGPDSWRGSATGAARLGRSRAWLMITLVQNNQSGFVFFQPGSEQNWGLWFTNRSKLWIMLWRWKFQRHFFGDQLDFGHKCVLTWLNDHLWLDPTCVLRTAHQTPTKVVQKFTIPVSVLNEISHLDSVWFISVWCWVFCCTLRLV